MKHISSRSARNGAESILLSRLFHSTCLLLAAGLFLLAAPMAGAATPAAALEAYLKGGTTVAGDRLGSSVAVAGDTAVVGVHYESSGAGGAYVYVRSGSTWTQQAHLQASNPEAADHFGVAVSIHGDTVVVSAPYEDSNATGVGGTQSDNSSTDSGAVYVFTRNGTTWSQQAYLKAGNNGAGDEFGSAVSISGDTVAIGAFYEDSNSAGVNSTPNEDGVDSGAAYVFTRSGTTWSQQAYLKASNPTGTFEDFDAFPPVFTYGDGFGTAVAVDGDTVVVGSPNESSGDAGNQADENAGSAGAAYVFFRSGTTWAQQAYLKAGNIGAGDTFGIAVGISGESVVVGANGEDSNGVDGPTDESASDAGAAYVFLRSGTSWSQQGYLKASNPTGGMEDFNVSPPVFTYGDGFGAAVAIAGDTVVVGSQGESSSATGLNGTEADESAASAGAAYVFGRSGTTWTQSDYVKAGNTGTGDEFGYTVAIAGGTVVVGARYEDSSTTGVNATAAAADENAADSGAAYVYSGFGPAVPVNGAPTDISLSAATLAENNAANAAVGTLSTTDPDTGNTFSYTKVTGTGDTDNGAFDIQGDSLRLVGSANFETKSSYSVRVRSTDQAGLFVEKTFTVTISDVNEDPTDISLSAATLAENNAVNAAVGTLSTADPDTGNTFSYTKVTGTGDTDNGAFDIQGDSLRLTGSANFETKSSYSVRVRTTDQGGLFVEKAITITITDVNEAPTLAAIGVSGTEDTTLTFTAANFTGAYTDPESTALASIKIETLPASGMLKLSGTDVTVSQIIAAADLGNLTYVPALNENGAKTFTVSASDGSLSSAVATVTMSLTAVNDAPSFMLPPPNWMARETPREWEGIAMSADGAKLVAAAGEVLTSGDSGQTWVQSVDAPGLFRVAMSADGTKVIGTATYSTTVYTSADSGATWTARGNFPQGLNWIAVASSADGTRLAVADNAETTANPLGGLFTSSDSGVTWTERLRGQRWQSIASSADGMKLAAVGLGTQIYTSIDAGTNWTAQANAGSRDWLSIASSADGTKLAAVVSGGQIYTSTDSGANWTARESNRDWGSIASAADGISLAAADFGGQIYISTDGGVNWMARESNRNWQSIASSADGTKLAAVESSAGSSGAGGRIYLSPEASTPYNSKVLADAGPQTVMSFATNFSPGPADESAQTLVEYTVAVESGKAGLFSAAPAIANNGTLTFTPAVGPGGTAIIEVVAQDSGGTDNGGIDKSTNTFTITVTPPTPTVANISPVSGSTAGGTSVTITGTGFTGATGVTIGGAAATSVTVVDATSITCTTPAGSAGTASVVVTTPGGANAANTLYTYVVPNTAPTLAAIGVSGTEDTTLTFAAANFTGAYTDPESTALASIKIETLPASGMLKLSGTDVTVSQIIAAADLGNLTYVPALNENGAKTFTVSASDGSLSSAVATVTMSLTAVNDAPSFTLGSPTLALTGLNRPRALAFDGSGNLYVANLGGDTVSKFAPGATTAAATLTGLSDPIALAFDSSGNLYVVNYGAHTVSKFAPGATTAAATLTGLNSPSALAFDGSGNLYVANNGDDTVSKFAPGATAVTATLTGLSRPSALAFDGSGNLYVANNGADTVSKFAPGATAAAATLTGLNNPFALAFDGSGNLYVANNGDDTVSKFAPGATTAAATLTGLNGPIALALDGSGNLYVGNLIPDTVSKFEPGATTAAATLTGLNNPFALAFDRSGNLYVANTGGSTVSKFASATVAADAGPQTIPNFATGFSSGPADESTQTSVGYTVTVESGKTGLFSTAPAIANNGTLTFTPAIGPGGSALITVVARDDGPGALPDVNTSAPQTFRITITPASKDIAIAATSATKVEGSTGDNTAFSFTVTRSGDVTSAGTVAWAVTGSGANPATAADFAGGAFPSDTVSFAAGATSQAISIIVSGDTVIESDEGFTVTLSNPSAGATLTTATAAGLIQNDDGGIAIGATSATKPEGNTGSTAFTFTVTRSGDITAAGTVAWAVTGSGANPATATDFGGALPSGTVSFAATETSKDITLDISGDTGFENDEGFTVTLSNPSNGAMLTAATASGVIQNDDIALSIVPTDPAKAEGNSGSTPLTFTVARGIPASGSGASTVDWAVTGSGPNPADAADFGGTFPSGTVNFPVGAPGQVFAEVVITINVSGDSAIEGDEGFTVTLSNPSAGVIFPPAATAAGLIQNDDGNHAPAGVDKTIILLEDTAHTFAVADFGFSDASDTPANALLAVKIASLPVAGGLTHNGVAVAVNQFVSAADIGAGKLKFTPATNANGAAYASFTFQVQDDGGTANNGIDLDASPNTLTLNVTPVNDAPSFALKSSSAGEVWNAQSAGLPATAPWRSIASSADGTKLAAVGSGGAIYTSTDSGATWVGRTAGLPASAVWLSIASSADGMKLAAGSDREQIYTSVDGGANWTVRGANTGVPDSGIWHSIASSADGLKLAAVESGGITRAYGKVYTSVNGGSDWTVQAAADKIILTIVSSADGMKLAAGVAGPIYTSIDGGANWVERTAGLPTTAYWSSIASSSDGTKLAAVHSGGTIYTSIDSGATWVGRTAGLPATANWNSIASSSDGTKLAAVGFDSTPNPDPMAEPELRDLTVGKFYTSIDGGANWVERTTGLPADAKWASIASSADGTKLAVVADDGRIYTSGGSANPTVAPDAGPQTVPSFATNFSPGPADESAQTLVGYAVSVESGKTGLFSAAPAIANNGTLTFTPAVGPGGSAVITVVAQDSGGTANGGVDKSTNTFTITITLPAPTVTSISPNSGSTAGGTSVTITGTGFSGATGVTIGGAAATSVTVVSPTSITCTTPAGTAGTASVVVTTPGGANAANMLYTYAVPNTAPTVTSISPNSGSTAGGTSVTIKGTGFTGATGVTIGGVAAPNVTVISDTLIGCITPVGTAGTASVVVTTPSGANAANTLYTYAVGNVAPSFKLGPPASGPLTGLSGPRALAFDGSGNLYVANLLSGTVSKFAPGATTASATLTGLDGPIALAFDGSGNLYVANWYRNTVSKFAPGATTAAATLTGRIRPSALAFDGSGNLYVADGGIYVADGGTVSKFAPGATAAAATLTGLNAPKALAFDGSGNLYVANRRANTVSKFAPGATTASATLTGLNGPEALAFDGSGNLYVANNGGDTVSKFAPGATTASATLTGLSGPIALDFDRSGNLYVANFDSSTVSKFTPGATTAAATLTGVSFPIALALDESDALHVANVFDNTVTIFPASTGIRVQHDTGAVSRTHLSDILAGPPEESGQTVSFSVNTSNPFPFSVPPSIDAAGTLTFTTRGGGLGGVATVTVTATDSAGASSAPQKFRIYIKGIACPIAELLQNFGFAGASLPQSFSLQSLGLRVAAEVAPNISLATFHALEGVLGESPEGRRLQDLYRAHGTEIVQMMQAQPALRDQMSTVLNSFQPLVVSLMSGRAQDVQITQTMTDQLNGMWNTMTNFAGPELAETLNTERSRFNGFQDFVGRDFSQWAQMLQVSAPSTPRINISSVGSTNGLLSVEANVVTGSVVELWGSTNLINWSPVPGAQRQTNGYTLWLTDPSPSLRRRFYRLQTSP